MIGISIETWSWCKECVTRQDKVESKDKHNRTRFAKSEVNLSELIGQGHQTLLAFSALWSAVNYCAIFLPSLAIQRTSLKLRMLRILNHILFHTDIFR